MKLTGLLTASAAVPQWLFRPGLQTAQGQNVLVVVFDTFSASNISLYGYKRKTTPNIDRLAERATVFHHHYAGGNFTTPGTATLLTSVLPWTHGAVGINDIVIDAYADKSLFHAFPYHRMAYSHNILANTLLKDFFSGMEGLTPREKLYLQSDALINILFQKDEDIAEVSWRRALKRQLEGYSYSLFLAPLYERNKTKSVAALEDQFPRGLPVMVDDNFFLLEDGINWALGQLDNAPQPFLGYYHFNPPHDPYHTRIDFVGKFSNDGLRPPNKPQHIFSGDRNTQKLLEWRQEYDEFILYVDSEFARLFDFLESQGILKNTWLVLTSDHGEMFERGIGGHRSKVLYQPVIHIPLLIFAPGQQTRQDVYDVTSAIDVLPTLAHLTNQPAPAWTQGLVLPPFSDQRTVRDVFSLQVEGKDDNGGINNATVAMMRENYKLIYYFGYEELEGGEMVELYDVEADPEELDDLSPSRQELTNQLLSALKKKLEEVAP